MLVEAVWDDTLSMIMQEAECTLFLNNTEYSIGKGPIHKWEESRNMLRYCNVVTYMQKWWKRMMLLSFLADGPTTEP